ncbi:PEP-CTERM sorting domain-containing protein [Candidatus Methylomicrobium oryzae]
MERANITLLSTGMSRATPNVPEPAIFTLLGFGFLGFAATRLKLGP